MAGSLTGQSPESADEAQSFYLPNGRWKKIAEIGNRVIQQCDVSGVAFEVLEHMED